MDKKKWVYHPENGIFIGLPALDMTDEEWQAQDKDLRKAALKAGVFEESKEVSNAKRS